MRRALAHYTIHRLRRKLRDASGFDGQELRLAVSVIAVLVAVVLGYFLYYRSIAEIRSVGCFANLLRIERGAEAQGLTCPVVNLRYREEERTTGTVISCPDPKKHLRLDSYLARRGERWELQPNFASAPGGSADSTGKIEAIEFENVAAFLEVEPSGITLEIRPAFLLRYVILPLGLMFSIFHTFAGFYVMVLIARDSDYSTSDALTEITVAFVFLVCLVGMGSLALAITLGGWDERVELDQAERSITIRECLFSRWRCSEERLDSVRAVLPAFVRERFHAVAYYEKDGELHYRTLFRSSGKDWETVPLMDGLFSAP